MFNPYDIVYTVLITEKSTTLSEKQKRYAFKVNPKSNKTEIKKAVEAIFKDQEVVVSEVKLLEVLVAEHDQIAPELLIALGLALPGALAFPGVFGLAVTGAAFFYRSYCCHLFFLFPGADTGSAASRRSSSRLILAERR